MKFSIFYLKKMEFFTKLGYFDLYGKRRFFRGGLFSRYPLTPVRACECQTQNESKWIQKYFGHFWSCKMPFVNYLHIIWIYLTFPNFVKNSEIANFVSHEKNLAPWAGDERTQKKLFFSKIPAYMGTILAVNILG